MIQISMATLICVYLFALTLILLGFWVFSIIGRTRRERESRKGICLCRICGFDFRPPVSEVVFRCPQCESLNELERLREI